MFIEVIIFIMPIELSKKKKIQYELNYYFLRPQ